MKTWEVGESVYINSRHSYLVGKVIKVTASGLVDVQLATGTQPTYRFNKDGRQRGSSIGFGYWIDDQMPFPQRALWIKGENARLKVAQKIEEIQGKRMYGGYSGRVSEVSSLRDEINRLHHLLEAAKELMKEVDND